MKKHLILAIAMLALAAVASAQALKESICTTYCTPYGMCNTICY